MEKRISEIKHTKNISYLEVKKLVKRSIVTTTYANIAKPTKNSTQNPRNGPSRDDKPNQRT